MLAKHLQTSSLLKPGERGKVPPAPALSGGKRSFRVLFRLFKLYFGNLILRLGGKHTQAQREQRILEAVAGLGMVWRHVACTLSLRIPLFSEQLQESLLNMRDRGRAVSFAKVRPIIEGELGRPLNQIFSAIEDTPFVATTVSQIHRARLKKEGIWVAVKVQQPIAKYVFDRDMKLFRRVINLLKFFKIKSSMRWEDLYHELNEIITRELNYRYELSALQTLRDNLTGQAVYVPTVFPQYSGNRVIIMEFIQGALLSDFITMKEKDPVRLQAWLDENQIEAESVAKTLFTTIYRQVFENNYFHGDLNPSSIILLRNSNIAIIDCLRTGSLERESLDKQCLFLKELAEAEYGTAAEIYFLLAFRIPKVNLNEIKEKLVRLWRTWETESRISDLPYEIKSMSRMLLRMQTLSYKAKFAAQWSLSRLQRTWIHLDSALKHLDPRFDYWSELGTYFQDRESRLRVLRLINTPQRIAGAVRSLQALPKRMEEYQVFQENMMRRQAQVAQGSSTKVDALLRVLFGWLAFTALLLLLFLLPATFGIGNLEGIKTIGGTQIHAVLVDIASLPRTSRWILLFVTGFAFIFSRRFAKRFQGPKL